MDILRIAGLRLDGSAWVDIDSGHWPMVTRPAELAGLLAAAAA